MINPNKTPEYEGLRFFGKMNASISHELRNGLAVINENAGLIKDLLLMSEKGHPLDIERVSGRVDKVLEQVRRTDSIIDNMNRFAHSVDDDFLKVDAAEYLEFVVRLSERFANMKGISLELEFPEEKVELVTFPFFLENILFLCVDRAMENPAEEKTIVMSVGKGGDRVQFRFSGLSEQEKTGGNYFSESAEILGRLDARITDVNESGTFILDMPESLNFYQGEIS